MRLAFDWSGGGGRERKRGVDAMNTRPIVHGQTEGQIWPLAD
jgi:hypothetical protein